MNSTSELIFKTTVDTGDSQQSVDKLNKSIKEIDKSVDDMGNSFNQAIADLDKRVSSGEMTFRQLNKAVKEYQSIAIQAGRESAVGQEALQKAAMLSDELSDLNNEVKALAHDGANMQAALQLGSTVAAGYGALQGAMALVGGENEKLQETFVKLQAVQSILAGIETVRANLEKESFLMIKAKTIATKTMTVVETVYAAAVGTTTGAMKALRLAMLALPIVAIIAGIVALVGWLSTLGDEGESLEEQNDNLTKSFEANTKAMNDNQKQIERNIDNQRKLAELQGASAEELLKIDQKKLAVQETGRKQELEAIKKQNNEKYKLAVKASLDGDKELSDNIIQEIKKNKEKYDELKRLDGQYQVDLKLLNLKYKNEKTKQDESDAKEEAQRQKERNDKYRERQKAHQQKLLEEQRLYEDLITTNIQDEDVRRMTQLKLTQERELNETIAKYGKNSKVISKLEIKQANERKALTDEFAQAEIDSKKGHDDFAEQERKKQVDIELRNRRAEAETKLIQLKGDFEAEMKVKEDLAKIERDEALANTDLTMVERNKIITEYEDKLDKIKEEKAKKQIEREKRVQEAATSVATQGLEAVQGLSDAFFAAKMSKLEKGSAEELRVAKKQFEINKKLQIAQAIVQGVQATLAAYSSGSAIPIVGAVTGPLFAALAAATAVANIAKIKNQTFESPGGSVSAPSVSAPQVPDFSASTQTEGLQGSGSEQTKQQTQPTAKVVLVDSELKTHMENSNKAEILSKVG